MIYLNKTMRSDHFFGPIREDISSSGIKKRISHYGFIEVSDVLAILVGVGSNIPNLKTMLYIQNRLKTCLINHDRGEKWFISLRDLIKDIDDYILFRGGEISQPNK